MKKKSCITMIYYMDGRDATVYVGMGGGVCPATCVMVEWDSMVDREIFQSC